MVAQNTHGSSTLVALCTAALLPEWLVEAQLRCQGKIQGVEGCRQADLNVAACPGGPLEHGKNIGKLWENMEKHRKPLPSWAYIGPDYSL
jgi:hypothetical protein